MKILPINTPNSYINYNRAKNNSQETKQLFTVPENSFNLAFTAGISVRRIPDIDERTFKTLSQHRKKFLRKKCEHFNSSLNVKELACAEKNYLPLMDDGQMSTFISRCKDFNCLKDSPIICLGRSPKWFLNTSLWMKNGIEDYKFVAFSGAWYRKGAWKLLREDKNAPTQEELSCYKKYLKNIQADPASIVKLAKDSNTQVVITDYVCTGKGMTSFLEVMADYADEQGVLDEFGKSFRIHSFGSRDFQERIFYDEDDMSIPSVQLPIKLAPYREYIDQKYYDIPHNIFMQMLENANTNECRATYYPHEAWTIYNPDKYKTGMIPKAVMERLKVHSPRTAVNFTPTMRDYRNLLNFRILDYLEQHELLR